MLKSKSSLSPWDVKKKHKRRMIMNKIHKKEISFRDIEGGRIKPLVKKCSKCHKRVVKYHHFLCEPCYKNKKEVEDGLR